MMTVMNEMNKNILFLLLLLNLLYLTPMQIIRYVCMLCSGVRVNDDLLVHMLNDMADAMQCNSCASHYFLCSFSCIQGEVHGYGNMRMVR